MMKLCKGLTIALLVLQLTTFAFAESAPSIRIQPVEGGMWQAIYELGFPVEGLRFTRAAGFEREDVWTIKTPEYQFRRDGNEQVLVHMGDTPPASKVILEFSADTRFILADYSFFNSFSDGGLAIFTGHFYASPTGAAVPDKYMHAIITHLEITPPPGQRVGLHGQLSDKPLKTVDTAAEGTFAYIGKSEPVVDGNMIAIVDKGMPQWVANHIHQKVPALLKFYETALGQVGSRPPLILFSYEPHHELTYSWDGGALQGLVQMRIQGNGWATRDREKEVKLWRFIAHEVSHLWVGQAAQPEQGTPAWMHEGAADALAEIALVNLNWQDGDRYGEQVDTAFNACIRALEGKTLNHLPDGSYSTNYACGHIMALWTDAAIKQENQKQNLSDLWRQLINEGSYNKDSYFAALNNLGVKASTVSAMQSFANEAQEEPAKRLIQDLSNVGMALALDDNSTSQAAAVDIGAQTLQALLAMDCSGSYGFYRNGIQFQMAGLGDCKNAQEGVQVTHMGGVAVGAPGFAAYHRVKAVCASKGKVLVSNMLNQGVELPCPEELPKPVWWHFVNL